MYNSFLVDTLQSGELINGPGNCRIPDLPEPRFHHSLLLTANGESVLNCGGSRGPGSRGDEKTCYKLDIHKKSWIYHSELNEEQFGATGITMPNGVYLLGGIPPPMRNSSYSTSEFLPKKNNGVWQTGPLIPNGLYKGCAVRISNEEIVLIGGWRTENRVMKFNINTNQFTPWNSLIQGRSEHSCVLLNDKILVVGGKFRMDWLNSTEVIPLSTGTPRNGGNLNIARSSFGLATVGGQFQKVLAFGDYGPDGSSNYPVEEWKEDTETWTLTPFTLMEKKRSFGYLSVPQSIVCPNNKKM